MLCLSDTWRGRCQRCLRASGVMSDVFRNPAVGSDSERGCRTVGYKTGRLFFFSDSQNCWVQDSISL